MKPVDNQEIFNVETNDPVGVWNWFKKNWKTVLLYGIVLYHILSFIFGWGGYSGVIAIKTGNAKVNLEFNDFELDSTNQEDLFDLSSFKPKAPVNFCIHHTGSAKDQSKNELWSIFRQRFSNGKPGYNYAVRENGEIITFAPIDWSPYLEYNEIVNGVKNKNSVTISVAITGGRDKNTMTAAQLSSLRYLWLSMKMRFPKIELTTHRELASTDYNKNGKIDPFERKTECPAFDKNDYAF